MEQGLHYVGYKVLKYNNVVFRPYQKSK